MNTILDTDPKLDAELKALNSEVAAVLAKRKAWMESKLKAGVTTRKLESGEELMVPYEALSEHAKELDRATVRAVYAAIEATC